MGKATFFGARFMAMFLGHLSVIALGRNVHVMHFMHCTGNLYPLHAGRHESSGSPL